MPLQEVLDRLPVWLSVKISHSGGLVYYEGPLVRARSVGSTLLQACVRNLKYTEGESTAEIIMH